jgi:hypothetical protein
VKHLPVFLKSVLRYIINGIGNVQGGSNMTGTNCDLFTHNQSRSYLNHLVHMTVTPGTFK